MKIRTKLILANLFIMLFLLGSLTYVLQRRSTSLALDTMIENSSLSLSQTASNLDNKLSSYEEIANMLFLNSALNEALQTRYGDDRDAYDAYFNIYQPYISAVQTTKDIYNVKLYTDNPTFVFNKVSLIDKMTLKSAWYQKAMSNRTGGYWTSAYVNPLEKDPMISFMKRLNNFDPDSAMVISVEIRLSVLTDLLNVESRSKRFVFMLADGTVLLDSRPEYKYGRIEDLPEAGLIAGSDRGSFEVAGSGAESDQVLFETLKSHNTLNGMKLVSFVPLNELTPRIHQLRSLAFLLFLIAFLLSAVLLTLISISFTRRLTQLSYKMKRLHKDNFRSQIDVRGNDEVAQLGEIFNLMVQRLGHLVQEVYQSEIDRKEQDLRTKEAELYALQTQINPHFLFNVLNMIRGKLLISGERENAKVVGLLAKSFRMMLKKSGRTVTLGEELEFIESYLQIQQYRFADKLSYVIDVPDEYRSLAVPKLSLQPLVENAISHGIELSPHPGFITIAARAEGDMLAISVRDTGQGMLPERLAEVGEWLRRDDGQPRDAHIGLQNVHRRLKQLSGRSNGLLISSRPGSGTAVTMQVPMQEKMQVTMERERKAAE